MRSNMGEPPCEEESMPFTFSITKTDGAKRRIIRRYSVYRKCRLSLSKTRYLPGASRPAGRIGLAGRPPDQHPFIRSVRAPFRSSRRFPCEGSCRVRRSWPRRQRSGLLGDGGVREKFLAGDFSSDVVVIAVGGGPFRERTEQGPKREGSVGDGIFLMETRNAKCARRSPSTSDENPSPSPPGPANRSITGMGFVSPSLFSLFCHFGRPKRKGRYRALLPCFYRISPSGKSAPIER